MRHLVGILAALALSVLGLASAQATTLANPPGITSGQSTDMPGDSLAGVFSFSLASNSPVVDTYGINAKANGDLTVSLQDNPGLPGFSTRFFAVALQDLTSGTPVGSFGLSFVSSLTVLFSGLIANHDYQLMVAYLTGPSGAAYGGSLLLSAVPLPASLPLFIAALGGLALLIYRRRQASAL